VDEPLQILFDELKAQGKTWEQASEITAGLENPWAQLDMAEWLARNRGASRQEILAEKHRLMKEQ
jgi:hypothetical protein